MIYFLSFSDQLFNLVFIFQATDICKAVFQDFPEFEQLYEHCSFSKMSDPEFCGKMVILDKLLTAMKKSKDKVLLFSHSAQVGIGLQYGQFQYDV